MEYFRLGEVADLEMGRTPARNKPEYWNGKNTWVSISDLKEKYIMESKEKITDVAISETKIKEVPKNTVIMSFKLSIGKKAITTKKLYTNEAIIAFNIKEKVNINVEYLYYALENVDFFRYTDKAAKGRTLNKEKLKKIRIPVCNMEKQKEIVNRLNVINTVIDKQKEQLKKIGELRKSLFYEMFGDADKRYEKEELNKNIDEMFIGPFGSSLKNDCLVSKDEGFCMVYEQKHAIKKTVNLPARYIAEKKYKELKRFKVTGGDIIVSCRGTIGESFIIPKYAEEGIMHPSIMKIRLKKSKYNNVFFNELLINYMKKSKEKNQGTGIKMGITARELGKEKFIIPPLPIQEKFAERIGKIDKLEFEVEEALKRTENLYNSLMQKFFG